MTPDCELLRRYSEAGDEPAFAELVRRHLPVVYGAAWRVAGGDAHLAQDVAQGVFRDLARKARGLRGHATLAGWLHTSTRFLACKAVRGEQRRRRREQEAAAMMEPTTREEVDWEKLQPLLDEAVGQLGTRDRDAVVLRFFQGKSYREVGAVLGLQESAAHKRVERALEKLRGYFARRGVAASAGLLGEVISANAAPAVGGRLAESVTGAALAGGTGGAGMLAKLLFMTTQTKIIGAVAIVVIAATIPLAVSWWNEGAPEPEVAVPAAATTPSPAKLATSAAAALTAVPVKSPVAQGPAAVHEGVLIVPALPEPVAATKPAGKAWVQGKYMAADDWVNAGRATPEDALQTLLWAKKHGLKSQVESMTVQAPPVEIDMAKGGTFVAGRNMDMSSTSGQVVVAGQVLVAPPAEGAQTTVVMPGQSPYAPETLQKHAEEALANPDSTKFVPATVVANPTPETELQGATIVSRQDISPSEVQFMVDKDWPEGSSPDTHTQSLYDLTLSDGGWKDTQHTVTIKNFDASMAGSNGAAGGNGTGE